MKRKVVSALFVGALALGGVAAGPGDSQADPPEEAENGCQGIQEAEGENGGEGQAGETPAADVLDEVEALLDADDEDCDDHDAASGDNGRS